MRLSIREIADWKEKGITPSSLTLKTHWSIAQQKEALATWTFNQKDTLFRYGVPGYDPKEYDSMIVLAESMDDLWDYEKQIFEHIPKKKRENILEHLTDFDENSYSQDNQVRIPTESDFDKFLEDVVTEEISSGEINPNDIESGRVDPIDLDWTGYASGEWEQGKMEQKQMESQEKYWRDINKDGIITNKEYRDYLSLFFDDELMSNDVNNHLNQISRTGGYDSTAKESTQQYVINTETDKKKLLKQVIGQNISLQENTKFYTTDLLLNGDEKVGQINTLDYFGSMHYNEESSRTGGMSHVVSPKTGERYSFEVCAESGTKGLVTSNAFAEHQFITDTGQKYIIYEIDHENKTGKAKLIK